MTDSEKKFIADTNYSVKSEQKRVAFIKSDISAAVKREDEDMVMSFPHLVIRGVIALQILIIVLSVISLLFDAPLKHIADPQHTEVSSLVLPGTSGTIALFPPRCWGRSNSNISYYSTCHHPLF
ncbi:MAG: hypothetical protein IID16_07695 [Candidatus Marinimicrobia bacterium]|nr:hypothetical protein [Candidatus Neomarinimicrobiota bacterium]